MFDTHEKGREGNGTERKQKGQEARNGEGARTQRSKKKKEDVRVVFGKGVGLWGKKGRNGGRSRRRRRRRRTRSRRRLQAWEAE